VVVVAVVVVVVVVVVVEEVEAFAQYLEILFVSIFFTVLL
jgi:hypothetical protein